MGKLTSHLLATRTRKLLTGIFTTVILAVPMARAGMQELPFEEYLRRQHDISLNRLFANISPHDGARGAVIASPSRANPDYYYHWVRDAALVMDAVVTMYKNSNGQNRSRLWQMLDDYVNFSRQNQVSQTLTGLGEPKFYVSGHPYGKVMDDWGRPQNDGPALRALALTRFAKVLLQEGNRQYILNKLYRAELPAFTIIKADLEFISYHWQERCYDLWEENMGVHFYTRMVQRTALEEGAELARAMGDHGAANWYSLQAHNIAQALEGHWQGGRIITNISRSPWDGKHSGLDAATIIAVLHTGRTEGAFSLLDDRIMSTARQMEDEFTRIYAINQRGFPATVTGRYPEDIYLGGNPWILTTASFAEFYYRVAKTLAAKQRFVVTPAHAAFFRTVLRQQPLQQAQLFNAGGVLLKGSHEQAALVQSLRNKGDEFMRRVQLHGYPDGGLSEQIRRDSGHMWGASDLTWNYASFLTATWAR